MIFATYWFVVFVTVVVIMFRYLPAPRARLAGLLLASFVFHRHFACAAGMLPHAVGAVIRSTCDIAAHTGPRTPGFVISAAALVHYKDGHFLATDVVALLSPAVATSANSWLGRGLPATPPLAISFFTFE